MKYFIIAQKQFLNKKQNNVEMWLRIKHLTFIIWLTFKGVFFNSRLIYSSCSASKIVFTITVKVPKCLIYVVIYWVKSLSICSFWVLDEWLFAMQTLLALGWLGCVYTCLFSLSSEKSLINHGKLYPVLCFFN